MPSDVDRVKSGLVSFIRRTLGAFIINRVDYLAVYSCKVISQNGDGSLDLVADDNRVGTFTHVPIRYGVPGISVTVPAGSRCYLTFGNGDPSKPIVVDWESGTILTTNINCSGTININCGTGTVNITGGTVNINGGTVNVGTGADSPIARYNELKTAYDGHTHTSSNAGPPSATTAPIVPLPTSVGASKGNVK